MDGLDFQPVTLSLGRARRRRAPEPPTSPPTSITFTPRRELYRKGNETGPPAARTWPTGRDRALACDASALPATRRARSRGRLSHLADRADDATRRSTAIEEVFDFVVDDCELDDRSRQEDAPRTERRAVRVAPAESPAAGSAGRGGRRRQLARASRPEPQRSDRRRSAASRKAGGRSRQVRSAAADATIRVDLDRVDRLINLVGELVINQAMLSQKVMEAGIARSSGIDIRSRRARAAHARNPGRRDGDPRPAGEAAVPAHGAHRARARRGDRQVGALADRGRGDRSRSNGHRAPCRSADPYDPQRRRSRPRDTRGAARRRQAGAGRGAPFGRAPLGPHRHRGVRRRRRHRPGEGQARSRSTRT